MLSEASLPSFIAQTTNDAPLTISPAANTPGIDVSIVSENNWLPINDFVINAPDDSLTSKRFDTIRYNRRIFK